MQFLFQPLTWGFLLVGVPILVHLINMLRHRKQSWAAMDFLLESYRKHRRWVLLKQWLLLASRILAMVLLVAMLARWISASQSLGWFGGRVTHHFVLLDDSYSMAEEEKGEIVFSRGLQAVQSLIRSIANQPGEHQLTLLRWSRAELAVRQGEDQARIDSAADLIAQTVPRDPTGLLERLAASQPTSLQLNPESAIELVTPLITSVRGEPVELTIVTDVRRNEWGQPESIRAKLQALTDSAPKIQIIDCADSVGGGNLSLVSVEPGQETWAAGVPLFVKFQVRNNGSLPVRNFAVKVRTILYPDGVSRPQPDVPYSGQTMEAPPTVIEQIAPGETVTRQVQVLFGVPGQHVVEVSIPDDRLRPDNRRWCVIGVRQSQRVLLVDGQVDGRNAFFLSTALKPGGQITTGMSVEARDAGYLRDAAPEELAAWDVIALLDVPRLEPQAINKLEAYCRSGGGLAVFAGGATNVGVLNDTFFRKGEGFFPAAIQQILEVPPTAGDAEPQVVATEHPVLFPLTTLSASPFQDLSIRKMLEIDPTQSADGSYSVVAYGPGRRPLVIDKRMGEGHVIALLTGMQNDWSTWVQHPTFVVLTLQTMGYLGSFRREPTSGPVGDAIEATVLNQAILPAGELLMPAMGEGGRSRIETKVEQSTPNAPAKQKMAIDVSRQDNDIVAGLLRPGIFESWFATTQGESIVRNVAHNVAGGEGDLQKVPSAELEDKLQPLKVKIRTASSLGDAGWSPEAASPSAFLLGMLTCILLIEQALAYSASYHLPRAVSKGGVS